MEKHRLIPKGIALPFILITSLFFARATCHWNRAGPDIHQNHAAGAETPGGALHAIYRQWP
ncbi:hypothetical protein ES705_41722 [subsurface metagenome]